MKFLLSLAGWEKKKGEGGGKGWKRERHEGSDWSKGRASYGAKLNAIWSIYMWNFVANTLLLYIKNGWHKIDKECP